MTQTTVQFVIERVNHGNKLPSEKRDEISKLLPYPVWVYWPAERMKHPSCGSDLYRILPSSIDQAVRDLGLDAGKSGYCACSCEGRVIE